MRVVERQSKAFRASVLLVSDDGRHLVDAAAPSLPEAYRAAIDGLEIGPAAGSCGTAAHRGRRVIVTNTQADPLWADFKDLAREHELVACWSQPITGPGGQVVGTFAMYYADRREPTWRDLEIIEAAARRAGDMVERARQRGDLSALVASLVQPES